ncbi:MAG: 50S ribosomal protein L21 [Candidatus Absconditabacterales bacterium]|nr:50S ribosomal protein L21 [Candidatus Absconditabacterales bacterium]
MFFILSSGISMYAIIHFQGHQYIVKKGDELIVDAVDVADNKTISIDTVVSLFDDTSLISLGHPYVSGASVKATIHETIKGPKVSVVKFKRKTRYFRNKGFRPLQTKILITDIIS